jgi:5-formyltetrahydrofolate cyclo-ligase
MDDKRLLRTGMWTARANRPAVDRDGDGARLASHAAALIALAATSAAATSAATGAATSAADNAATGTGKPARLTIAAYAGIATEPPTRPLLDALRAEGVRVLLPVVATERTALDWAPYEAWEQLTTTRWGLLEPASERLGAHAIDRADLVVVPSLAVDRAGHRLGRGRGFYDRALGEVERNRRVAIVYADEVVASLPAEPHDEDMGWALTPDGLTELKG